MNFYLFTMARSARAAYQEGAFLIILADLCPGFGIYCELKSDAYAQ